MTEQEQAIWNAVHQWCDQQQCEIPDQNRRALMDRILAIRTEGDQHTTPSEPHDANNVLPSVDYSDQYRNIKTKENYTSLLKSGMFWEFHPELTGIWYLDEPIIHDR